MSPPLSIIDALDDPALFGPWFPGSTWDGWRTVLKGAYALPMDDRELAFFRSVAERDPPTEPVKELWVIAGRRAGKDSIASAIAAHAAALFTDPERQLRPGERALVMCLATDRDQARIVLNYTRSYFTDIPMLQRMVERETAFGFELSNKIDVTVSTNNHRAVRGRPARCIVLDEVAFFRDADSAAPDEETYAALKPALATISNAMIIGISTPYRKSGLLYKKYREHYGKPGKVLVIKAPTTALNPTIDPAIIAEALKEDPAAARAEWQAEFRDDIAGYVDRDAVLACVDEGVFERPAIIGQHKYVSFTDPSGGSNDSMTCAVGHTEGDVVIVDAIREIAAPFDPESAANEFVELFRSYGMTRTHGDRYAAAWCSQAFEKRKISYSPSELPKSGLYQNLLPSLNGKTIRLLDHPRAVNQIAALERRTVRGGRDSIDHAPGARDDVANAIAGLAYVAIDRRPTAVAQFGTYRWG